MANGTNGTKKRTKGKCKGLTPEQARRRNENCHDARIATWEKMIRAVETAEMEVEQVADGVLDGGEVNEVLEKLCDIRNLVLSARPRMVAWD